MHKSSLEKIVKRFVAVGLRCGYVPARLLPPPILIQSGKIRLTSTLIVFSAVGKTDIPPQICSTVYRSCATTSHENALASDSYIQGEVAPKMAQLYTP